MNLSDIFDMLLETRVVSISIAERRDAEVPRVSLLRKFKDYKDQMNRIGFLDPALETSVVSLEWDEENKTATFYLREKKTRSVEYTLVTSHATQIPKDLGSN